MDWHQLLTYSLEKKTVTSLYLYSMRVRPYRVYFYYILCKLIFYCGVITYRLTTLYFPEGSLVYDILRYDASVRPPKRHGISNSQVLLAKICKEKITKHLTLSFLFVKKESMILHRKDINVRGPETILENGVA